MPEIRDIERILQSLRLLKMPASKTIGKDGPRIIRTFYDSVVRQMPSTAAASRFMNFGYWESGTRDPGTASENLMDRMRVSIPDRPGRVLDVACGTGATTRYLARHLKQANVFGMNISRWQIVESNAGAVHPTFAVMDATQLAFVDECFGAIICVEAAFHFQTRTQFLCDALRLLRTGGVLVLTDVLLHQEGHALLPMWLEANYVSSLEDYKNMLRRIGYRTVDILDITERGWQSWARHQYSKLHEDWIAGCYDFQKLQWEVWNMHRLTAAIRHNLLCVAKK